MCSKYVEHTKSTLFTIQTYVKPPPRNPEFETRDLTGLNLSPLGLTSLKRCTQFSFAVDSQNILLLHWTDGRKKIEVLLSTFLGKPTTVVVRKKSFFSMRKVVFTTKKPDSIETARHRSKGGRGAQGLINLEIPVLRRQDLILTSNMPILFFKGSQRPINLEIPVLIRSRNSSNVDLG